MLFLQHQMQMMEGIDEKYFIVLGIDYSKWQNENQLRNHLKENIAMNWKQNIEVTSLVGNIEPADVGLSGQKEICSLLRLRGDNIQEIKAGQIGGFSLVDIPSQIVSECEVKLDKRCVEILPNLADVITNLIASSGIEILEDENKEYWLKGKWFQVAVAKRILTSYYEQNCNTIDFDCGHDIGKDGIATKIIAFLLGGNSYPETKFASFKFQSQIRADLALSFTTIALKHSLILKGKNKISLYLIKKGYEKATLLFGAPTQTLLNDSSAIFKTELDGICKQFSTYSLPVDLPIDYNKLVNEVIQLKFKPTLTILHGNGKNIIYALPISQISRMKEFVTRYMECATPSPTCGTNVLKMLARPYRAKQHKEEGTQQSKQPTSIVKYTAMFTTSLDHMRYLHFAYKDTLTTPANDDDVKTTFAEDNSHINIEGMDSGKVQNVLYSIKQIYEESVLVTKELPYGTIEIVPPELKILILHSPDSSKTTLTGPKHVVEIFLSTFQQDSDDNPTVLQNQITSESDQNHASNILNSAQENRLQESEKKKSARRNRQLVNAGSATPEVNVTGSHTGTPITNSNTGVPTFPILSHSSVYKHVMTNVYVEVGTGDITKLKIDAIVNAANKQLRHEGGVAFHIAKAAGQELDTECQKIVSSKPLEIGDTCVTTAGNLPCKKVIHAVGPAWHEYKRKGECLDILKTTFQRCLEDAALNNCATVAVPALCSGIYGVPIDSVVEMGCSATVNFLLSNVGSSLKRICFVDINPQTKNVFDAEFRKLVSKRYFTDVSNQNGSAV